MINPLIVYFVILKQFGRHVANHLDEGLNGNAVKYKVMVDSSGGKMIVKSGK